MDIVEIPAELTDATLLAIVIGFFQPLVLDFLIQSTWSSKQKALAAAGFSVVTGTLTALFAGAFTGLSIVTTILLVAVVSISAYKGLWKQVVPGLQKASDIRSGV